jgi:hypothetical protein
VGACVLCGMPATLRMSHYLPAAFFRRVHRRDGGNILHPISLNSAREMYDCKQPQARLLCDACEHRFKVQGEDWVIECTCHEDGRFPLRDLLRQNPAEGQIGPTPEGRRADRYTGNNIRGLRQLEIVYFAASVFWRGWVLDWSQVSDFPKVELSPGLGIEFRDFLLGKSPFPPSVVLQVEVALNPTFDGGGLGMIFPDKIIPRISNRDTGARGYFFMVFGITFILYFDLGKPAGLRFGKAISIAEPPHPIFLTDVRMSEADAGRSKLLLTAKRVGRLARS